MARLPRLVVPNQPHHVIQRGNDRQPVFRDAEDYETFLRHLREAAKSYQVAIHAYVLMANHIHLLASPSDKTGLSRMMQWAGRHYVPYFNRKYRRTGTLWEGRYRGAVIDAERYFLVCSRYIELNPVRAGIVTDPAEYPWSSYLHHAGIKPDGLIMDHPLYWALGNTPFEREMAYKELIGQGVAENDARELLNATLKGWVWGSDAFKKELERQVDRRLSPAPRGRPMKRKSAA